MTVQHGVRLMGNAKNRHASILPGKEIAPSQYMNWHGGIVLVSGRIIKVLPRLLCYRSGMPSLSTFSRALWIAAAHGGGKHISGPAPFLRKGFTIPAPIASASLSVTALGLYECELNGRRVGDLVFTPGWTDYRFRLQYQTYDVASLLAEGENALGAILGEGWYSGHIGWLQRQNYGDRPGLLVQLDIALKDGRTLTIASDPTWKVTRGPILENDFMQGETYDARFELGSWSSPGYDDSAWLPVTPIEAPAADLLIAESSGPAVKRHEEITPVLLASKTPNTRLFDFGQNFSGRVRLTVEALAGTTVKLRHAEVLNPDGTPYYENLRDASATDYYTCKGGGPETWEPRFTFHGFRYAEVSWLGEKDPLTLTGIALYSDMPSTGHFACSNPLLNQLQSNILWGQKGNFLEVPTDCPQRNERLGWTGDAQVFVRTACFNRDVRGFFHKWVQDLRDAQLPSGSIPPFAPDASMGKGMLDGGPAWADATIICPWTIYLCYGDTKILSDHYASMTAWMDDQKKERCIGYIRAHPDLDKWPGFGDWLALDGHDNWKGSTPSEIIGTAFLAYDLDLMTRIAGVLGHADDAKAYSAWRDGVVSAFQHRFLTAEGLLASGTQTAHVLALHFDLVPDAHKATVATALVRSLKERKFHLATGFVGTPYLLDVLERHGHLDTAYKLLEQETYPSWLFPVKNGATTIWERWDGWSTEKGFQSKEMNSFNHYAYGAVGSWMYQTVAGLDLDPANPGYRHIIFRPHPGGSLTWAEASLQTPQGETAIRWDLEGDELRLQLTVPAGSRATFIPPVGYTPSASQSLAPGKHSLTLAKAQFH